MLRFAPRPLSRQARVLSPTQRFAWRSGALDDCGYLTPARDASTHIGNSLSLRTSSQDFRDLTLKRNYTVVLSLALLFAVGFLSNSVFGSSVPPRKRSKADRDIAAIGHRQITCTVKCIGNWYSLDQEKTIGGQLSASLEQSTPLFHDPMTAAYLDRLAKTIAQNSDTQMPTTVRVADSEKVYAFTLPGGYQYISRGLLLQVQSEGELASVLARGIAHTALRSATKEATRANLTRVMTIPRSSWDRMHRLTIHLIRLQLVS